MNDACHDQPVEQFAWFAATIARQAIPFCAALDKKFSRNEATLLRTCSIFSGDRLAAAEAWNRGNGFRNFGTPDAMDDLPAYDLELEFQGTRHSRKAATEFWRSLMAAKNAPHFSYYKVHGRSADQVIVAGHFLRAASDDQYETADVQLRWEKDGNYFELKSIKVGSYRTVPSP